MKYSSRSHSSASLVFSRYLFCSGEPQFSRCHSQGLFSFQPLTFYSILLLLFSPLRRFPWFIKVRQREVGIVGNFREVWCVRLSQRPAPPREIWLIDVFMKPPLGSHRVCVGLRVNSSTRAALFSGRFLWKCEARQINHHTPLCVMRKNSFLAF